MSTTDDQDATDPKNLYGYTPSKAITILFVVLFIITTVTHCWQALKYNRRWLIATAGLGGLLELIGWLGRAWSSFSPENGTPYKIQAVSLIFGPTPLLGANFIILGEIIKLLGQSYSRIPAKKYSIIFLTCDILCLLVQGGGGGIAASATTSSKQKLGTDIILVGIAFQTVVIVGFMACASEFFYRFHKNKPFPGREVQRSSKKDLHERFTPGIRWMSFGLLLSVIFFLIRSFYRIIELADGWDGVIIHTQIYFDIFDGLMITLAMYTINVFHPGRLLPASSSPDYNQQTSELNLIKA